MLKRCSGLANQHLANQPHQQKNFTRKTAVASPLSCFESNISQCTFVTNDMKNASLSKGRIRISNWWVQNSCISKTGQEIKGRCSSFVKRFQTSREYVTDNFSFCFKLLNRTHDWWVHPCIFCTPSYDAPAILLSFVCSNRSLLPEANSHPFFHDLPLVCFYVHFFFHGHWLVLWRAYSNGQWHNAAWRRLRLAP